MGMTHENEDHGPQSKILSQLLKEAQSAAEERLLERAQKITPEENSITAGLPGETSVEVGEFYGVHITRRPEDPDCLRVSIGEVRDIKHSRYLVFRGPIKEVADLVERAARALRRIVKP